MDMESKSKEMIENPDSWPLWPYLPLVNKKTKNVGYLFDLQPCCYDVYNGNIYAKNIGSDIPVQQYSSFDEFYEAGWRID